MSAKHVARWEELSLSGGVHLEGAVHVFITWYT